jgi:flagellar biogenesis protein FliO
MDISDGVDASQNVKIDYSNTAITIIQGVDVGQNTRLTVIEGTDTSQNVRLDYSNTAITIIQGTDVGQNARMTIIEGTDVSQNVRLDFSNTRMTIIDGVDSGQNSRMTIIEGTDVSQNVRLDYSNTRMTIIDGVDVSQNARMVIIEGTDVSQNARMTIIEGVDVGQNTNISTVTALAQAAFNRANTEPDAASYLANTVIVANSTGYLSNSSVFFTSSNNTFITTGPILIQNTTASISNTTGALVVTGGTGITGNLFMSSANNYYSTTTGQSYRLGWADAYFYRDDRYGGVNYFGNYLNMSVQFITSATLSVRNGIDNDSGNNTIIFNGRSGLLVQNGASSISNTTGALIVQGGLGLSGNLSMNLSSSFGTSRLALNQNAFITAGDGLGNLAIGGSAYWYFNNTGGIYNQNTLYQRGVIANDTGNNTILFFTGSPVKIQNGTASTNTTTGALVVQGGVGISGALNATTKSFNIPHPTKEGKDLRYGSLEGPEFGVYVRGTLKGSNVIELPDY